MLRALIPSVYAPTVLEAAGEAALLPVVPLLALRLGFSTPAAAALTMIAGAAAVLGPIPVGRLMLALGARRAIVGSGAVLAASNLLALVVVGQGLAGHATLGHRAALIALLAVDAATGQVWALGRQSYLGTELPPELRARGMTMFGGMLRIGQVVGPLLGAGVAALGHEAWVFGLFALLTAAATAMVAGFMVPREGRPGSPAAGPPRSVPAPHDAGPEDGVAAGTVPEITVAENPAGDHPPRGDEDPEGPRPVADPVAPEGSRAVLHRMLRVGAGVTPLMMGRINRPVIVPLLGAAFALSGSAISAIFGVAAVIEILMVVPAGAVMDRWGRAAVAVPCSAVMGVGYLALTILATTVGGSSPTASMVALAVPCLLIAVGNGLGSGIVLTLGIDVSPQQGRTRYLSWWNTVIGIGRLAAPLLVAGVALVAPMTVAAAASGMLCLAGAGWLRRELPRALPREAVSGGGD